MRYILVDGRPARVVKKIMRDAYELSDGSRIAKRESIAGWLIARPGKPIDFADVRPFGAPPSDIARAHAAALFRAACEEMDAEVLA